MNISHKPDPTDPKCSSSPSFLARQLHPHLVATEGSDILKNFNNIVVSIHIATFQAMHDYLRPRILGLMLSGSHLGGMLAALVGVTSGIHCLPPQPHAPHENRLYLGLPRCHHSLFQFCQMGVTRVQHSS